MPQSTRQYCRSLIRPQNKGFDPKPSYLIKLRNGIMVERFLFCSRMERKEASTCETSPKEPSQSASSACALNLVSDWLCLLGCPIEMSELGVSEY